MPQSARKRASVLQSIEIYVDRDHSSVLAHYLRQMRRLAARRRRTIDDRRAGSGSQHPRGHLRYFGLSVEQTVAICARLEIGGAAQHDRLGGVTIRADFEAIGVNLLEQLPTRSEREIQPDSVRREIG